MSEQMSDQEKIWLASLAVAKRMDYYDLRYCDYLYGHEDDADEVWDYVSECEDIGKAAFKEKYKEYKLYPGF